MGIRDLEFVAKRLGWVRSQASRVASRHRHTDTNEVVSTTCRRMGELPDENRFNSSAEGKAYISKVMSNGANDHARKAERERRHQAEHLKLLEVAKIEFPEFDPEEVASVINEMAFLSTGHRNVFAMYCRGLSSAQIAGSHGNPSTIRSQIRECKLAIRARIAEKQR